MHKMGWTQSSKFNFEIYEGITLDYKKNDKSYKIASIGASKYYSNNFSNCLKDLKIIRKDVEESFNIKPFWEGKQKVKWDKSGKTFMHGAAYDLAENKTYNKNGIYRFLIQASTPQNNLTFTRAYPNPFPLVNHSIGSIRISFFIEDCDPGQMRPALGAVKQNVDVAEDTEVEVSLIAFNGDPFFHSPLMK